MHRLHRRQMVTVVAVATSSMGLAVAGLLPKFTTGAGAQLPQPDTPEEQAPPLNGDAASALAPETTASSPAATPAVPAGAANATTPDPAVNSGMTTSLGGSDVAVSSVGGSYEVDGPKRRARKAGRRHGRP